MTFAELNHLVGFFSVVSIFEIRIKFNRVCSLYIVIWIYHDAREYISLILYPSLLQQAK